MISAEKWKILQPLPKLPKNVGNLGKIIVATGFKKLPNLVILVSSLSSNWKKFPPATTTLADHFSDYFETLVTYCLNFAAGSSSTILKYNNNRHRTK